MMRKVVVSWLVLALLAMGCASSGHRRAGGEGSEGSDATGSALYPLSLMREGSVALQQGDYELALKRFEKARELQPKNATVHNMIGICHLRSERHEEALGAFDEALRLVPSFTDARNNRGLTYLAMDQLQLAKVDFLAVLNDPTYPHRNEVHFNLGMVLLQQGRLTAAEENFREAAYAPRPVYDARLRLADVAREQDRMDEAETILEQACVEFANRPEAYLQLARLRYQRGDREAARGLLEKVLKIAPGTETARKARRMLEDL